MQRAGTASSSNKRSKAAQQQQKKPEGPVSLELAEIVRSVSGAERSVPLPQHLQVIRARRAQETECCLRACAVRLRLRG
jgi:hypothetical protein